MKSKNHQAEEQKSSLPAARVKQRHGWTVLWLVPIFAAGVAAWLIYREFVHSGYDIEILFKDVSGLEEGKSQIKFRGVDVGRVRKVTLDKDRNHSVVQATLAHNYRDLAREGTTFWIVRPEISGSKVHGLNTLVSQDFIELRLGRGDGHPKQFVGAEEPPVTEDQFKPPEGLRIRLLAPRLWGLKGGSRIYYRGVEVGSVLSYEVTEDANAISFEALIEPKYASFVHPDTKFWKVSGIDVSVGLFSGLQVQTENLQSLLGGGVEFATPPGPAQPLATETVFPIHEEPKDDWKQWRFTPASATEKPSPAESGKKAGALQTSSQ